MRAAESGSLAFGRPRGSNEAVNGRETGGVQETALNSSDPLRSRPTGLSLLPLLTPSGDSSSQPCRGAIAQV